MKPKILSVLFCFMAISMNAAQTTSVDYKADTTIFPNPERGFLIQATRHADNTSFSSLKGRTSELSKHATKDQGTLVLTLYYLDEYRYTDKLPQKVFDDFEVDMDTLRKRGMKAIVRIAYAENGYKDTSTGDTIRYASDAPLYVIKSHLAQFKPYWKKHADVIFVFQAGFVGQYGEWYYTDKFENHIPSMDDSCRALLDTALLAIPMDRCLLLRRPMFKMEYTGDVALTAKEAYTNTPKARLGHYNDGFLYHEHNMGTYSRDNSKLRTKQIDFVSKETLFVPVGGETDITKEDQAKEEATYDKTIAEMEKMHWTFIKSGYSHTVTDWWRKNGTFDELNRRLGYRYELVDGEYDQTAVAGGQMRIKMNIRNVGFAPLYNKRIAYIALKNGNRIDTVPLKSDPRTWLPNGDTAKISEHITIPANLPAGTYQLYLYLPDYSARLKNDPRYAIRFANEGVWEASTGMNKLNAQVTVTASGNTGNYVSISGTLNKSNVASVSNDMTYYNTDYFDFGPTDARNTGRWAEWNINVSKSGEYTITTTGSYTNGHQWKLILDGDTVHPYSMPSSHKKGDIVTETGTTTWYLSKGMHTICVKNVKEWGRPKLLNIELNCVSSAIVLPATLDKSNVTAYSDDMAWSDNNLFDFGPKSVKEQTRWAEWEINVQSAGIYIVAIAGNYPNCHIWQMELGEEKVVDTLKLQKLCTKYDVTETATWLLPAGTYTLRIKNILEWGQPKLKSITFSAGVNHKPQAIEKTKYPPLDQNAPMYDILGRQVNASYQGIVIQNGRKYLLH